MSEKPRVDVFIKKLERILKSESDRGMTCAECIGALELFKGRILAEWDGVDDERLEYNKKRQSKCDIKDCPGKTIIEMCNCCTNIRGDECESS